MKYLKTYKLFENIALDESDLADLFSEDFIEKYFEENYEVNMEDVYERLNLWYYVDKDLIKQNEIDYLVSVVEIDDLKFNKKNYIDFIKNNIKGVHYEKLDREQLIDVICDHDKETEFLEEYFKEEYINYDAEDLLIEIYGKNYVNENLHDLLKDYLNVHEEKLIQICLDSFSFDFKYNYFVDWIGEDINLQKKLIEMDSTTVIPLFGIMSTYESKSIGKTYEYQKKYIEECIKEYDKEYDENEIEEKNEKIAKELKKINDKFKLDPKIEKEYGEYTYLIDTEKYNL